MKTFVFGVLFVALVSVLTIGVREGDGGLPITAAGPERRMPACRRAAGPELFVLDGGLTHVPDKAVFGSVYENAGAIDLPVRAFLIVHPKGLMVWDTGLDERLADVAGGLVSRSGLVSTVRARLTEQLRRLGVDPLDVKYLAFSHFHYDHTGNANLFRNATIVGQRDEYEFAFGPHASEAFGYQPATYEALAGNPTILFIGDHDVFGDGTVRILRAAGHTVGSQALLVDLPETGPVLISGDLWHFAEQRTFARIPPFNFSANETAHSMRRIEGLLRDDPRIQLWISHDPAQMAAIRLAPWTYR